MKNILCFGDSNTWGYQPIACTRYPFETRWTGALQTLLGSEHRIIEEGLNGRTSASDEPGRKYRSGAEYFPMLLECHRPLDLVVIMLGTNDLKSIFDLSVGQIAQNTKKLCQMVLDNDYPENDSAQVLLIAPVHVAELPNEDELLFGNAKEKSRDFSCEFKKVADELGIHFMDASQIVKTTNADGLHWTAEQHQDFASAMNDKLQCIFYR